MEKVTDWNSLWRELVEIRARSRRADSGAVQTDIWSDRAHKFDAGVKRRWSKPDSSRDFIMSRLDLSSTVLDIGAGTGAWSALLAPAVRHVTAVEPSPAMIEVMRRRLTAENITNVTIIRGAWPDVAADRHDFSLCSHAMYGCSDLAAFIRQMVASTRSECFLLMRAPTFDGVMAEAAQHIWSHPLDSPNFAIAYNILLQLGIYANVIMEDTGLWEPKKSATLEDAMNRLKRHFGLNGNSEHDEYLIDLLRRRLKWEDGHYVWPPDVRSALVHWQAAEQKVRT